MTYEKIVDQHCTWVISELMYQDDRDSEILGSLLVKIEPWRHKDRTGNSRIAKHASPRMAL